MSTLRVAWYASGLNRDNVVVELGPYATESDAKEGARVNNLRHRSLVIHRVRRAV